MDSDAGDESENSGRAQPWRGVPLELTRAWDEVFRRSREATDLSAPCPVCRAYTLHRWFQVGHPEEIVLEGQRFRARGGLWEWCSSCRSYEHASAFVPEWWASDLDVDETKLTAEPGAIEAALRARERLG
jgi:hypothetical protein